MNKKPKYLRRIACVLGILILTTSMIMSAQLKPLVGTDYTEKHSEGSGLEERFTSSYDTHLPIVITSNGDFTTEGFTGSGSKFAPYVLEGYNITTSGTCISITGTDAYFEIRECLLIGGAGSSAVRMNNIVNGELRNNTFTGYRCVYLYSSSYNNTVVNNTFLDNTIGVGITSGFNNTIMNNTITESTFAGLDIESSSYNNTVVDNIVSGGTYGAYLHSSSNNTLLNNTIFDTGTGVYLYLSSNENDIVNNTISGTNNGIWFSSSDNNTLVNNMISGNGRGVRIDASSDNNLVYHNVIADCTIEDATDDGTSNQWNTTSSGNFWSNYAAIGVYYIPGDANSIDYFPSIYPPDSTAPTINQPADVEYEEGTSDNEILWTPSDAYPSHYVVFRNNIEINSNNWDGNPITLDVDNLSLGVFNFTIVVYDLFEHLMSDTVIVTVIDSVSPTVSSLGDIEYLMGTSGHNINWTLNDAHPNQFVVFRNGIEIVSGSWGGNTLTLNIDGLSVGVFSYTIRVYDTTGNTNSDTVIVTVTGPAVTTTETTSTTTSTNGTVPSIGTELALVIGICLGGFGVGVIALILKRFRRG